MNLLDVLIDRNRPNFDQTAIYFYEKFNLTKTLTYQQLFSEIEFKSQKLKKIKAQGFVLLCLVQPLDFVISFLALVQAGCVPVPLAPANAGIENQFVDRIKILFTKYIFDFVISDDISRTYFETFNLPILDAQISAHKDILIRKSKEIHLNACFIQFSSGSTSDPKGIVIQHQQLLANLEQIRTALDPLVTDKLITWLPLYHDMGLIGAVLSPLYAKAEVHLMATRDYIGHVDSYLKLICDRKINFILGPDFMYRQFSKELMAKNYDLSHLKVCMSGAELVLPSTVRQFQQALKVSKCDHHVFRPVYGMAEACLGVTFTGAGQPAKILKYESDREVVNCGLPLNGQALQILDSENQSLSESSVGQVAILGPSIFENYFMNLEIKEKTAEGYYLTGDEGFIFENELYLLGRKKDVIIYNGIKHHSVDLENIIFESMKKDLGRIACVQAKDIFVVAEIAWHKFYKIPFLRQKIAKKIAKKVPIQTKNVFIVPKFDLPRTTSGKIQRYKVIAKIEEEKYQHIFYFIKSIFNLMKEIKGLSR
jgi:fatty-acyl-CoA synthase